MNEEIRADFGNDISRSVSSETIMRFARKRHSAVARFVREREKAGISGYDFEADPKYIRRWSTDAPRIASSIKVSAPLNAGELCGFVGNLCKQFKVGVGKHKHYKALWVDGTLRREKYCQTLFDATVRLTCGTFNIDVSPETDGGYGPVDFKFSRGATRTIVELKLARSTSLKDNSEFQIPTYADTEATKCAYVVIIQSLDKHVIDHFVKEIETLIQRVGQTHKLDYKAVWVDARPKPSASKLREPR